LEEPSEQLSWIIDDISDVLSVANVKKLLHRYFIEGRGSDPIVHFYETFLVQYDPDEREQRGVYYTPEDVVGYIVRSLNIILKEYFEKADGFACENVTVLDPAAGTLTFLAETAKTAVNEFSVNYGSGGRDQLIKNHILKNFYAFELMMAPYAVGHLKMSFLLEELGYKLHKDDRFKLYLTNTLELEDLAQSSLPGMSSLSEESYSAGKVKKEQPILVILGNPPYSGHSANKGKWISKEIREYYKVDGKDLGEKNPKWLQDDYVKFIRFAQWKIDQAGEGVLGFITNHSYLDNPTFRGMRQSLMNSFDHIHILDLHGNSKKKEKCPDGSKDRNVFDIQQGVAIIIAVKKPGLEKKISHADLWGLREEKSIWLKTNNINSTKWKTLSPKSPFYFFVPRDEKRLSKYEQFSKITDIFPVNSVGIVTSRDRFTIDADKEELKRRINMFRDDNLSGDIIKKAFNLKDKARWKVKDARSKIRAEENWEEFILPILYRPFDKQWIFYHDTVIERTRKKVMSNMTKENLSLLCCRQQNKVGFRHAFISDNIVESCIVSDRTREIGYTFPIYTYPTEDLYNGGEKYQRDINIDCGALLQCLSK
jgi:predicted helicase